MRKLNESADGDAENRNQDRCRTCGISRRQVLAKHEEVRQQLVAMTAARDHCKKQSEQADDLYQQARRELQETLSWLRDNHPAIHEAFLAEGAWG